MLPLNLAPELYLSLGYEAKLALHGFGSGIIKYTMVREIALE